MKLLKNGKLIASALALILGLALGAGILAAEDGEVIENDMTVGKVIGAMVKRLPSVWKISREAKKVARDLPDYQGEVPAPGSELIYSWIEELCQTPHRRPGTAEDHEAEQFIAARFREFGLENVALDPVPLTVWTAERWSLAVDGAEVPSFFVVNTGFTGPSGVAGPLAYVGVGQPKDFAQTDVKGKIVVADVPFPYLPSGALLKTFHSAFAVSDPGHVMKFSTGQYLNFVRQNFIGGTDNKNAPPGDVYWNAYKRGAVAVCLILRDQPSKYNTHYGPYDGVMKPMPALWIGKYDGDKLREQAQAGAQASLVLEGNTAPGVMHNVWGILPGLSDDVILVTSHHDAPFQGATEDGAGAAQVLAQAWAWSRVPKERRPRTMVFVVDGGHFYGSLGGRAFAREHQDIMASVKILITLEHLGAKEVREKDGEYEPTGKTALTVMFTSPDPQVVGAVIKAFAKKPPQFTASIPSDFFGKAPTSDAAGYVLESGVPVISWIGCPYYLLDSEDTLDKIEKSELKPIAETVTELVKAYMAR
ncbi:MAG TPA: M28 family peptidase [bacterium]|nr:M28 family peptidase [bacterium]